MKTTPPNLQHMGGDHQVFWNHNMKAICHQCWHTQTDKHMHDWGNKNANILGPCRAERRTRANGGRGKHPEKDEAIDGLLRCPQRDWKVSDHCVVCFWM